MSTFSSIGRTSVELLALQTKSDPKRSCCVVSEEYTSHFCCTYTLPLLYRKFVQLEARGQVLDLFSWDLAFKCFNHRFKKPNLLQGSASSQRKINLVYLADRASRVGLLRKKNPSTSRSFALWFCSVSLTLLRNTEPRTHSHHYRAASAFLPPLLVTHQHLLGKAFANPVQLVSVSWWMLSSEF